MLSGMRGDVQYGSAVRHSEGHSVTDAQQSFNALAVASLSLIGLKPSEDETEASLRKQAYYDAGIFARCAAADAQASHDST